jgi:hypothetical protein
MNGPWLRKSKAGILRVSLGFVLIVEAVLLLSVPKGADAAPGLADARSGCESGKCAKPLGPLASPGGGDHKYGTTITWVDSPREAGKLAEAQHKLAFIIQLSGDFTRDEFT